MHSGLGDAYVYDFHVVPYRLSLPFFDGNLWTTSTISFFFFYSHPVSFYDDNSEDDYIHVLLPLSAEISRCFGMVVLMTVMICLHYSIYILL